ncbi:MAG: hypothetical protein Q9214_005152 [Letrouitia sp. 1 TL-2023]
MVTTDRCRHRIVRSVMLNGMMIEQCIQACEINIVEGHLRIIEACEINIVEGRHRIFQTREINATRGHHRIFQAREITIVRGHRLDVTPLHMVAVGHLGMNMKVATATRVREITIRENTEIGTENTMTIVGDVRHRRAMTDRDREDLRSPPRRRRSRSASAGRNRERSPPSYGGLPSKEVMLDGIPKEMDEEDVRLELAQHYGVHHLDDIRIIRDRQTTYPEISRGFGFLRFPSLARSRDFVESNYPSIFLHKNLSDNDSAAVKVRIAFSREKEDGVNKRPIIRTDIAAIKEAHSGKPQPLMNGGDSDVSDGAPSQFLLFRNLEPTVNEQILARGVSKLYKPSRKSPPPTTSTRKKANAKVASTTGDANLGAREGSLRRVLLVRDRRSRQSWRYGFAEFATIEDAQAALIRYRSFKDYTIASKTVLVNNVHSGIFVPVSDVTQEIENFTFSPLSDSTIKLRYWDDAAYANELIISTGSPKLSASSIEPQAKSAADIAAVAAEGEGLLDSGKEIETKLKRRKAEATSIGKPKKAYKKQTTPAQLQEWTKKWTERRDTETDKPSEQIEDSSAKQSVADLPIESKPDKRTYADLTKNCCYLCTRQFKTTAEVTKHERLSQLHEENLKNGDLVSKAEAKMAKAGISTVALAEWDKSEYRDRAEERRKAYSNKSFLPMKKQPSLPEPDESGEASLPPPPSKGRSLLGKMGWSAGEGLGAQGTGRTEAIATDMYAAGVGLGAQGGKIGDAVDEAGRKTKADHGDWTERAKEVTKERYKMAEQR